jgi:hypothetical protein
VDVPLETGEEATMEAKRRTYFAIDVEDRPGELFRFALKMKEAGVNLSALWAFGVGHGRAKIYAVPIDVDALARAIGPAGYTAREHTAFELTGEDKVGILCETLDVIEGHAVNLHAVDAVAVGGRCVAYLWAGEKDVETVGKLLGC